MALLQESSLPSHRPQATFANPTCTLQKLGWRLPPDTNPSLFDFPTPSPPAVSGQAQPMWLAVSSWKFADIGSCF